ncbi:MAG: HIT family protein [Haliscomenobacter sp.]|nr:HIT family protein [Haliscomenobacter sp.]MBK8880514.1 HIT family protein [Haliscomenobacter sp.]
MPTIFSRIVSGEIPSYKVAEDEEFFAFLDIRPQAKGHTLVIPKEEIDYLFDLPPAQLGRIMGFAQNVARAIREVVPCERIGVAVIGLEVPHAHIHLVPLNSMNDISFAKAPLSFPAEEMQALAAAIAARV